VKLYSNINRCDFGQFTRVYPKVSGLAAWSKNCKWYISVPLGAVMSLCLVGLIAKTLCIAFQRVFIVVSLYFLIDSVRKNLDTSCYESVSKTFRTSLLEGELQMVQLSANRFSCIAIL
jgi:hypothetical protein